MTKIGSGNLHSVPSSLPVQPGSCTWPFLLDRKLPVYTSAVAVRSPPSRFCRSLGNYNSLRGTTLGYLTRITVSLPRCGFLNHLGCPRATSCNSCPLISRPIPGRKPLHVGPSDLFLNLICAVLLNCWTARFSSVVGRGSGLRERA